jgi:NAD(P)-dependent dehydrogenase (short-subunit alcohol dehydrogenase family)
MLIYKRPMSQSLSGRVALVAGATRGAGRGIALALGERGMTVYCTGRSTRARRPVHDGGSPGKPGSAPIPPAPGAPFELAKRPETIEDTADLVTARGGEGVAAVVDHADPAQVAALVARIRAERGRLDVLVNDVWGADELVDWGQPFWELSIERGLEVIRRAVFTHLVTARLAVPLLVEAGRGLVVEVTDGDALHYRGQLHYDLAKMSVIRMAFAMAEELRPRGVAAVAVTPGFLRSEAMLDHFGVTEATWREAVAKDPHFAHSETPLYVGRAVAALAADPDVLARSGRLFSSWGLAREYGFTDADGAAPDFGRHAASEPFGAEQRASHERFVAACAGST